MILITRIVGTGRIDEHHTAVWSLIYGRNVSNNLYARCCNIIIPLGQRFIVKLDKFRDRFILGIKPLRHEILRMVIIRYAGNCCGTSFVFRGH